MAETTTKKMNSLAQMQMVVERYLNSRDEYSIQQGFTNQNRCYYIITRKGEYILKWSKEMYRSVNFLPEFKGKGAGMTINREFVDSYSISGALRTTTLLFSTLDTNESVYGLSLQDFQNTAATHEQPSNGEWVYAIPVKLLDKFC